LQTVPKGRDTSSAAQALPLYRGLRPLGAEKIEKNRSQNDRMEIPVEFSHGLADFCTKGSI
jgi:hypothetical protein